MSAMIRQRYEEGRNTTLDRLTVFVSETLSELI
jgi:hypothetical protein